MKKPTDWPEEYEAPKLFHVDTAFEQAMGLSYCADGNGAGGGRGSCSNGNNASGVPGEPNACSGGATAMIGPGSGNSPCGMGSIACAQG